LAILASLLAATLAAPGDVAARDRYDYCRAQAERISGYHGPVPDRHLRGGAGRGAVRGAVAGAALGAVIGGSGRDARRAARAGLVVGAISGAAKRARARDEQRDARYIYDLEFDRCMDNYR
jgi:outer membrane lipoprotein SlyB